MITLQPSLFPQKGDFDPNDFQDKCLTPEFKYCLQQGAKNAMACLNDVLKSHPLCTRNRSSFLHEYMASSVKEQIDEHMSGNDGILCYTDSAGNKRDVLKYNGYTFIYRKNLKQRNDSGLSDHIDSQNLDSHVITIHYDTDSFWTSIASLSLLYIENDTTIYSFPIALGQEKPIFKIVTPSQSKIEKPKLSLKKDKAKRRKELV